MQSEIKVGQRFKFNVLSDNRAPERMAVVTRVLSDKEEGLGPEVELHIGLRLTNFQKQGFRQRWYSSVELTETYTSTDVKLA